MRKIKNYKSRILFFKQWSNKNYAAFNSMHKMVKICTLVASYSILINTTDATAQEQHIQQQQKVGSEDDTSAILLDEVQVVSTRVEQNNSETGRSISIIKGYEIQQLPIHSIDELLRYIPGLEVQSRNSFGTQSDIIIRGSTFNQVLILVDGQRLNDPITGHFNSNIPISTSEIRQIEVLRGPAASVYGPDAVGGVINIITKTFSSLHNPEKISVSGEAFYGSHNLISSKAGASYSKTKFSIGGGYIFNKSDGEALTTNNVQSDFNNQTLSGSASWHPNQTWKVAYRLGYDYRNFSAINFYTASIYDTARETVRRWWNQISISRSKGISTTEFAACYQNNRDSFVFFPGYPANVNLSGYFNTQLNQIFKVSEQIILISGLQNEYRQITSNDRGDHNDWHQGVYVNAVTKPFKNLNFSLGLRGDYEPNYNFQLLPNLNIAYQLKKFSFRASGGRSIRSADYTERYNNYNKPYPLAKGVKIGNPWLRPESNWGYEAGMDFRPVQWFVFSATGFQRFSDNLIDYVQTNANEIHNNSNLYPDSIYLYASNIEKLNTYGVEIYVTIQKQIFTEGMIRFLGGYTWVNSSNNEDIISVYISNHSNQLLNGSLNIMYKIINFSVNGIWKSGSNNNQSLTNGTQKSYALFNTNLDVAVYKKLIYVSLQADNILDEEYYDILGAIMPGRWLMAGVKFNFINI